MLKKTITGVFVLTIISIKLYLIWPLPIQINSNSSHDGYLFVKLSHYISQGNWLGPFNDTTLAKGPVYSFFIALNSFSFLPLKVTEYLLYALACITFYFSFKLITKNKLLPEILFLLLIISPYVEGLNTLVRESIYSAQLIFILGFFNFIWFFKDRNLIVLTISSIFAGLTIFAFWYTREEGVWIIPYLVIISLFFLYTLYSNYKFSRKFFIRSVAVFSFILVFFICEKLFALKNKSVYGVEMTLDVKTEEQKNAFEALYRVKNYAKQIPYLHLNKASRAKIYEVSPSFKKVKSRLETYAKNHAACRFYPQTKGDIPHGWFGWTYRLALRNTGLYKSPKSINQYYRKLANEINKACQDSLLACDKHKNINLAPFRNKRDTARFYASFKRGINLLQNGLKKYDLFKYSTGKDKELLLCRAMTNTDKNRIFISKDERAKIRKKEIEGCINILKTVYEFYNAYLLKIFFWGSIIFLPISFFIAVKFRKLSFTTISALGIISIIFVRLIILSIIDATAFNAYQFRYVTCIFPLMSILFIYLYNDILLFIHLHHTKNKNIPDFTLYSK